MTSSRRRVLVLGASGHIGRLTCAAIERANDVVLCRGTRSRPPAVDATRPQTFGGVRGFDILVNCADTAKAPPRALAAHCLHEGVHFIETSADPAVYSELSALPREGARAAVVLGGGAFPGLSTIAAAELAGSPSIDIWVRWSALSGAGRGTVEVMLDALTEPTCFAEGSALRHEPPLSTLRSIPRWGPKAYGVRLGMPDPVILVNGGLTAASSFWAVLTPRLPRWLVRAMAALSRRGVLRWRVTRGALRALLLLLRAGLLRRRATPITLLAHNRERFVQVAAADAFAASATVLAAQVAQMPLELRGCVLPHETASLGDLIDYARDRNLAPLSVTRGTLDAI